MKLTLIYPSQQKIKGIPNVFEGEFDHSNDKMNIHCYQKKTGKQFIDFLKSVKKKVR